MVPTLKGSKLLFYATLSGSEWCSLSIPVALPPAIEFVAFGDIALLRSAMREAQQKRLPTARNPN